MGDIEAMFHQVKVSPADRDVLRFLWWNNGIDNNPEIYRMTVHLFGGIWCPSCATFALRKTAEDHGSNIDPEVVQTVTDNLYVDDCLKSLPTEKKAVQLVQELCLLLTKGGFKLNKWTSNSRVVLESIPKDHRAKGIQDLDLDKNVLPTERALGVHWDTETDQLGIRVSPKTKPMTRRGIISVISSIYDPLGLVSPFILQAKKIFQDETRSKKGWDESLKHDNVQRWSKWLAKLPKMESFKVQRCVLPAEFGKVVSRELHHFSDASQEGYGAVSYLRAINSDGDIHCCFLTGTSRLAPIKPLTIPRLELSAAVISVKLDRTLRRELKMDIDQSVFWTDSTIVLQYLTNESKRFHTFVANRVALILDGSSQSQWRHVDTKLNPADDASRGLDADKMVNNDRWKRGPDFLWKDSASWPDSSSIDTNLPDDDKEVKREAKSFVSVDEAHDTLSKLVDRYSSWYKLKRAVAYILRLKNLLLQRVKKRDAPVTFQGRIEVPEIQQAEVEVIKAVQQKYFMEEITALKEGKAIKSSSVIYKLEPVLNSCGVICVGGRLSSAPVDEQSKHQVIIPKGDHLATLIIRSCHEAHGHVGKEHVLSLVRQKFWIVQGRVTIKRVLRDCVHCRRRQAKPGIQRMADLPTDRVSPGKPSFTFVGIDYFGPFLVKRGRSQLKRYGCLFTCLNTRAIHLEKADSMDTDSFIDAFKRFECRRGRPEKVRSDNGSNFRAGEVELRKAIKDWNVQQIAEHMRQKEICWEFNPPLASHMGGVWERNIRTVRKVLNSVLTRGHTLDDEGLSTVFCEVEFIVNSRPLTAVSDDPNDMEPLTPNHLLILRSGPTVPIGIFGKADGYRRRWKQVQFLADIFWRRWVKEYLPTLQLRQKWFMPHRNFSEGDVVLLLDEGTPRLNWPMGRIVKTFPGKDGLVRSVEVRTKSTLLTRPVHKLCLLESYLE